MTNNEMKKNESMKNISTDLNKVWHQANACKLIAGDLESKIIVKLNGNEAENELEEYARTLRDMLEAITDSVSGSCFDIEHLID